MDGSNRVIAFVADDDSMAALRAGLVALGEEADVRRGTVRHAARFFEKSAPAPAVVVDIEGLADPLAELDALARVCPPDVKVFVIGTETRISFYRQLVNELGVTEYIHKPLTRDYVERLLVPHLTDGPRLQSDRRLGHVVAVCGAGGGVGTTTVAINLALEIERVTSGHVALLDMHLQGGRASVMLSVRPGPGLRIALEEAERIDALFLERSTIEITPRLRLIAAEEGFDAAPAITEAGVVRVLDLVRQKFNFVIIDVPMPLHPAMRKVISLARHVVVVLAPNVGALRDANDIRSLVVKLTGSDRMLTVLNHANMKGALQSQLVAKGLKVPPQATIPDLGKRMIEAANLGVPAVRRVPALRRHLAPIVKEVAGADPLGSSNSLLKWMTRR